MLSISEVFIHYPSARAREEFKNAHRWPSVPDNASFIVLTHHHGKWMDLLWHRERDRINVYVGTKKF